MSNVQKALEHAHSSRERHLEEYRELLRIPSISTLSEHKGDIEKAAAWIAEKLRAMNMKNVSIMPTDGHPVVYAERIDSPDAPTVLVYGHYDVQPVDPVNEWETPPFDPAIRGDYVFARGASDMKGQIIAQILAVESLLAAGPLPVNLKYLIEGEEEIGSPHLGEFIDQNKERLSCDFVLNCDAGIHAPDVPAITHGLRGLAYFEIEVYSLTKDMHSGLFGGTVHNPAQALCELIAGMHDADGRVTLPGFYDNVRVLTPDERAKIARVPYSDDEWKAITGAENLWGEAGYTTLERMGARPTLEVNGMLSGFTGEGSKTVLPAKAMAKISMRLVPDQDAQAIHGQLCEYMRKNAPNTITWEVRENSHAAPAMMRRDTAAMKVAAAALKTVFGAEPLFKREGGTVPVVSYLKEKLGVDSIMLGFALPTDGIHGPNERQHLPNFFRGIETYIHFFDKLSERVAL